MDQSLCNLGLFDAIEKTSLEAILGLGVCVCQSAKDSEPLRDDTLSWSYI